MNISNFIGVKSAFFDGFLLSEAHNLLNNSSHQCPFGMLMPERSTSTDSYRYAYNGMEMDNEVSGNGNSYTTEFRQYDARLGRWKSLDPLMGMFPHMSPYVAFDNNPVYYNDIYGLSASTRDPEDRTGKGDVNSDSEKKYRMEAVQADIRNGGDGKMIFLYKNVDNSKGGEGTVTVYYTRNTGEGKMTERWKMTNQSAGINNGTTGRFDMYAPEPIYGGDIEGAIEDDFESQAGSININDDSLSKKPTLKGPKGTEMEDLEDAPKDPPPNLDLDINFIGDDKYMTKSDKEKFLKEVKKIGKYLSENPNKKITLEIFTPGSRTGQVQGGKFKGSSVKYLVYMRYRRTRDILIYNYPNIKSQNVIFVPHYNQPEGDYKLEINFN